VRGTGGAGGPNKVRSVLLMWLQSEYVVEPGVRSNLVYSHTPLSPITEEMNILIVATTNDRGTCFHNGTEVGGVY
jgi:hypothetical protein